MSGAPKLPMAASLDPGAHLTHVGRLVTALGDVDARGVTFERPVSSDVHPNGDRSVRVRRRDLARTIDAPSRAAQGEQDER